MGATGAGEPDAHGELGAFLQCPAVMNKRYRRGLAVLEQVDGPAGLAVTTRLARSIPGFERLLVEFPFGDVYARPGLGLREREIATVAALTAPATRRRGAAARGARACDSCMSAAARGRC